MRAQLQAEVGCDTPETAPTEDGVHIPLCPFLLLIYKNPLYTMYISPLYVNVSFTIHFAYNVFDKQMIMNT